MSAAATARFVDAHCDAPMQVVDRGADFVRGDPRMHVTLPGLERAGVRVQVFASCAVYPDTSPERVVERGSRMIDAIWDMAAASDGRLVAATDAEIVRQALDGGPIAALIALEGADPLDGRAENLREYANRGVRSVIFAWKDNEFAGTAFGTERGLTQEGERLLGLAEELSVMVDVSHLSDQAFRDVCRAATRPFLASHSNCRSLCPHPRNLTDEMIRSLADQGGVMGVNLAPHFLAPDVAEAYAALRREAAQRGDTAEVKREIAERRRAVPRPGLEHAVRHIVHAIRVGGEDAVGLGGDLDGIEALPAGIESVADYVGWPARLRAAGLTERQVEKVCWRNFARVFDDLLP